MFLADGTLFAETMIRQGDAIHYVYDGVPSIHADQLAAAEEEAKASQVGLWSPTTCQGNAHEATKAPYCPLLHLELLRLGFTLSCAT